MSPGHLMVALRRTVLGICAFACFVALAAQASAAPLCADMGFTGSNDGSIAFDTGDGVGTLGDGVVCRDFFPGGFDNARYYLYDTSSAGFEHLLRVTVTEVLEEFGLAFFRNYLPAGTTFPPNFSDSTCVAYAQNGQCVEYTGVFPDNGGLAPIDSTEFQPVSGVEYLGPISWLISWSQPVGTNPIPEIIHEIGEGDTDEIYDEILQGVFFSAEQGPFDFACDSPYFAECGSDFLAKAPGDPTRGALSDNFTNVALVQQVPEPGTVGLLGLGLSGVLLEVRRRRRIGRQDS